MKKSFDKIKALQILNSNREKGISDQETFDELDKLYYGSEEITRSIYLQLTKDSLLEKKSIVNNIRLLTYIIISLITVSIISRIIAILGEVTTTFIVMNIVMMLIGFFIGKYFYDTMEKEEWFDLLTGLWFFCVFCLGSSTAMRSLLSTNLGIIIFILIIISCVSSGVLRSKLYNVSRIGAFKKDKDNKYIFPYTGE